MFALCAWRWRLCVWGLCVLCVWCVLAHDTRQRVVIARGWLKGKGALWEIVALLLTQVGTGGPVLRPLVDTAHCVCSGWGRWASQLPQAPQAAQPAQDLHPCWQWAPHTLLRYLCV